MTTADDRDIAELEAALGRLASNPRISTVSRRRLTQLHSAVRSRRLGKADAVLSDRDLDRFELMMARLQIGVQAKKQDLELQLKQYDQREKRLTQLLDAIDEHRRQRDKETGERRRASSAKRSSKDSAGGSS
jgi:hypothetical protein